MGYAMTDGSVSQPELAQRVEVLEQELGRLRRAMAALANSVSNRRIEELIDESADRPLSEAEMEAVFDRLDAAIDSAP